MPAWKVDVKNLNMEMVLKNYVIKGFLWNILKMQQKIKIEVWKSSVKLKSENRHTQVIYSDYIRFLDVCFNNKVSDI